MDLGGMNYLAHLFLSSATDDAIVGSLLGDFVKGDDYNNYPKLVCDAIILHRHIDAFTDAHPIPIKSRRRLNPAHRHTRGIMVDMFYDHFLARNWLTYTDVPLGIFTDRVYSALTSANYPLPDKLRMMMPHMIRDDWLQSYAEVEYIGWALAGLSKRRNVGDLAAGLDDLKKYYKELEADFTAYFPELIAFVAESG